MKVCFVTHDFDFFMVHTFDLVKEIAKYHEVTIISDMENAQKKDFAKLESKSINLLIDFDSTIIKDESLELLSEISVKNSANKIFRKT